MSKIVDRLIAIPEKVSLDYNKNSRILSVNGPNGSCFIAIHPSVNLDLEENSIRTSYYEQSSNKNSKALTGTMNSLIFNAINGSLKDYTKTLEIKGVGYRATVSEKSITVSAGYSHDVVVKIPSDVKVECLNGSRVIVKGCDKQKVGSFASKIRDIRRPNVFVKSLKGIFYEKEVSKFKPKAGKRDSKK